MSDFPVLHGLHHVTAVTADARANHDFYTRLLGMRLVKKTVNQDDTSAYHLFYADDMGSPGTELTFFEWPQAAPARPGAGTVSETALRVAGGADALTRWQAWFAQNNVGHGEIEPATDTDPASLAFQDFEGQSLRLLAATSDENATAATTTPTRAGGPPAGLSVVGLGAVTLTVPYPEQTARVLTEALGFRAHPADPSLYETGAGGVGARLRLATAPARGYAGAGGVHHVAWLVRDRAEQTAWRQHLEAIGLPNSGLVDRFYFQSLYFRIPGNILFEIATAGPGFTADEPVERLGETLSLPPFLEERRAQIEAGLQPLETTTPSR